MKEFYAIITNSGLENIVKAKVDGTNVNLTHMSVGDSNGAYYTPDTNQTALKNEQYRGNINRIYLDPDYPTQLIIEAAIHENVGGFFIREIGVWDENGDLFAIGKYPVTYKPSSESGSGKDLYIRMVMAFSSVPNVNLYINPHSALVSTEQIANFANKDFSNVENSYKDHQNWLNLQGGNKTERYHLTQNEHNTVYNLQSMITVQNKEKELAINETGDSLILIPPKEIFQNEVIIQNDLIQVTEKYSIYKKTVTKDIVFNIDASEAAKYAKVITFELHIEMFTKFDIKWHPSLKISWLNDEIPEFDDLGHHLIAFRSFDNGISWVGSLQGRWE